MEKEKELEERKSGGIHKFERDHWSEFRGPGNSSQSKHTRCVLSVLAFATPSRDFENC